jgi:hypothetical protein
MAVFNPTALKNSAPNELMGDGGNGAIFLGTKGKMMCGTYGKDPKLLPTSRTKEVKVPQTVARGPKGDNGHYAAWVLGAIAGYGSPEAKNLSSNFDIAGPLTESVLMGNLAIRSYNISRKGKDAGAEKRIFIRAAISNCYGMALICASPILMKRTSL